jgi:hypothetical protein
MAALLHSLSNSLLAYRPFASPFVQDLVCGVANQITNNKIYTDCCMVWKYSLHSVKRQNKLITKQTAKEHLIFISVIGWANPRGYCGRKD